MPFYLVNHEPEVIFIRLVHELFHTAHKKTLLHAYAIL
jgi:hypothetical protein